MSTALKLMSTDEFLLWAEGKEGRWELHDGVPVLLHAGSPALMAPERAAHVRVKFSAATALQEALKGAAFAVRGLFRRSCRHDRCCGPRSSLTRLSYAASESPPTRSSIDNPIVVVEVLSPSTAAIDHGRKLSGYFSLPSVEHYLILDPERRVVIHHKRGQGDAIETRVLSEGSAKLDPPGFAVAVEALFPPIAN